MVRYDKGRGSEWRRIGKRHEFRVAAQSGAGKVRFSKTSMSITIKNLQGRGGGWKQTLLSCEANTGFRVYPS